MKIIFKFSLALFLLFGLLSNVMAQDETSSEDIKIYLPNEIKWVDGPASIPKGAQMVVLEGNPTKEGPFTVRLKFPANYSIAPHTHPGVEHLTVISGEFMLGMGNSMSSKPITLPVGSFAIMQPESPHYAKVKASSIIQLQGIGPWDIKYLNESDDPRNDGKMN